MRTVNGYRWPSNAWWPNDGAEQFPRTRAPQEEKKLWAVMDRWGSIGRLLGTEAEAQAFTAREAEAAAGRLGLPPQYVAFNTPYVRKAEE